VYLLGKEQAAARHPIRTVATRWDRPRTWDDRVKTVEQLAELPAFRALREEIIALAQLRPDDRVLDLGAGTGLLTFAAASRVQRVTALDISPPMCQYLAQRSAELGVENVDILVGDARRLPLADASADVVVSNYCLHHLRESEKEDSLREIGRVLTPGGRLVIGDMMFRIGLRSARDRAVVLRIARRLLRRGPAGMLRLVRNALRVVGGRAEHPASVEWWQEALADTGFVNVNVRALSHEGGLACARRGGGAGSADGATVGA
jgi:ubiquinone/menaquinone biosynthesis C-methylase UbiE